MTGPPAGRPGAGFGGAIAGVVIGGFGWLVISGLVMWWRLPWLRVWGGAAVGGGVLTFLLLIWTL